MATAQDLINRAFRLNGVLEAEETPTGSESANALEVLNDLLDEWTMDRLMVYQLQEQTHTLVAGTGSYTVGSAGAIAITRPVQIESAFIRDSNNNDLTIKVVNKYEFDRINSKTSQTSYPTILFYDPGFANGTINLYPVPNAANTLHFTVWKPFSSISTLVTTISLPPGYQKAIVYNLSVELGEEYGSSATPRVLSKAEDMKANIRRINNMFASDVSQFDSALFSGRGRRYNIFTDR